MRVLEQKETLSNMMRSLTLENTEGQVTSRRHDEGYESSGLEEPVLEPLRILDQREEQSVVYILYSSKGLTDNRYCPYSRLPVRPTHFEARGLPVLLLRRRGQTEPSQLEANLKWENNNELRISKTALPQDIQLLNGPENEGKIQIYVKLDPNREDMRCFLADIRCDTDPDNNSVSKYVGPIVIFLKAELSDSQEERLLASTSMEDRTAAFVLVEKKELQQLTAVLPPHGDTVLSVLCAQKNPASRAQNNAQIYAVVQRLLKHQAGRETILRVNKNRISALEIAAITNNHLVASYLAEVIYNLIEDQDVALDILNYKDSQENTIIHLLARKGDTNINTLRYNRHSKTFH